MNAWARAGKPERAESLLREMYEDFVAKGTSGENTRNGNFAPKTDSFNSTY